MLLHLLDLLLVTWAMKTSTALQAGLKKNPVSQPARHLGPPLGFRPVFKQANEPIVSNSLNGNPILDDYSWLDGYQLPSSIKGLGTNGPLTYSDAWPVSNNSGLSAIDSFPFPGKQVPSMALKVEKQNGWQDYQTYELLKAAHQDQQLLPQQQLATGNQHYTPLPGKFQGQSIWTNHYFV